MKSRVISLILAMLLMATAIAGCGSNKPTEQSNTSSQTTQPAQTTQASQPKEKKKIGVLWCLMSAPSVQACDQDAKKKAAELGYELVTMDANFEPQTQANQMMTLISQKVDAIILNPVDGVTLRPAIKEAKAAGIPVILVGMAIDEEGMKLIDSFVGLDDYVTGLTCGKYIAEKYNGKGATFALIQGKAGIDPTTKNEKGFKDGIANTDIKVVDAAACDFDRAKAMAAAEDFLVKYPKLTGFFAQDDTMAMGVGSAIEQAGKLGKVSNVCPCGIVESLSNIPKGYVEMMALVQIGYCGGKSVEVASNILTHKPFAKNYIMDANIMTADNYSKVPIPNFSEKN